MGQSVGSVEAVSAIKTPEGVCLRIEIDDGRIDIGLTLAEAQRLAAELTSRGRSAEDERLPRSPEVLALQTAAVSADSGMTDLGQSGATDRVLFLARAHDSGHGYMWPERGEDGPHRSPEGVAKAAKLYRRLFDDYGPFVMVEVHLVPDIDVPINEDAAEMFRNELTSRGRTET